MPTCNEKFKQTKIFQARKEIKNCKRSYYTVLKDLSVQALLTVANGWLNAASFILLKGASRITPFTDLSSSNNRKIFIWTVHIKKTMVELELTLFEIT